MHIRGNSKLGKNLILPHVEKLVPGPYILAIPKYIFPQYLFHMNFRKSEEISAKLNDSVKNYNKNTNESPSPPPPPPAIPCRNRVKQFKYFSFFRSEIFYIYYSCLV